MENQNNPKTDEMEIDLGEIFRVLFSQIPMMIAVGLFVAAAAFLISDFVLKPTYESTTKIYILTKHENTNLNYTDIQMGTQLTKDYAELIQSRFVLEEVIQQLNLDMTYDELEEVVSVTSPEDTRIIYITVSDYSPVQAMKIANAIRNTASIHIKNIMDIESVNVAEVAFVPTEKASPNVIILTVAGGIAGAMLVAVILVIVHLLDDTIKTSEDIEKYLNLSTLALIPVSEDKKSKKKRKAT